MENDFLLPTQYLSGGERLLHGKAVSTAVAPGRAEDWVRLDTDVFHGTLGRVAGWNTSSRLQIGGQWFDGREISDWGTAPYWREADVPTAAAPSWGRPPTASELALCLCHADARVRAAALDTGSATAPLPLLLLRCADGDVRVRERARRAFAEALAQTDDGSAGSLAALALRIGRRRHGHWARDAVLARTGGIQEPAVQELLASEGGQGAEARLAGIRAGAEAGLLDVDALYRIALTADRDNSERLEAVLAAFATGQDTTEQDTAARKRFIEFLDACENSEVRVSALRHALSAQLPSPGDLTELAVGHRDRHVRRLATRALLDLPCADTSLDQLLAAPDGTVRGSAIGRLRAAARPADLAPYLTDPSPWVRSLAARELRAAGGDPHARYRTLCADPETVTPAAVSGLAEHREPRDAPLLGALTRHKDGAVRARALGGLRRLGVLAADALAPYADDPDPRVGAVVLRGLRDDPVTLRALLAHPHARVRARALVHLTHRHSIGWHEALPLLTDPAKEVSRAARGALWTARSEVTVAQLVALTAQGEQPERRALAMQLLARSFEPEALLTALRLLDDPLPAVRAAARADVHRVLWDRKAACGPHADEIRALAERHQERITVWLAETRRRNHALRNR
ncbi:hypothetical protein [Streptomyces sp. DSM 40907]|uniref:hypothetical protein n=1 Tax=Streptomyces kutzneri TaxID=3051179 RepID=UPI0028D7BA80|nr:hypothetical protein [Streptomyces sp. DSM 40907]